MPAWTSAAGSLDALLELSARAGTRRARRRAVAAALQEAGGRTTARRAVAPPDAEHARSSRSARAKKDDALAGFERWKARHPEAAAHLKPADVLVDAMRGRFRTWTRVRVNLQHVPEALRPAQEPLDPDENMADDWRASATQAGRPAAPKTFASS